MYIRARIQIFAKKTERSKSEIGTLTFVYSKLQGLGPIGTNPIFMFALIVLYGKDTKCFCYKGNMENHIIPYFEKLVLSFKS